MQVLVSVGFLKRMDGNLAEAPVDWIAMDDSGTLWANGNRIRPQIVQPEVVWLSEDLWFSPCLATFLDLAMASRALRWTQTSTAGVDAMAVQAFIHRGVVVTTSHGQAVSIAEYVLAGVLDHFQGRPRRRHAQASRQWTVVPFREICSTRWVIFGYGAVGQALAERVRAFGAVVTGVRRTAGTLDCLDEVVGPECLDARLPEADVVVLSAPSQPTTARLFGERTVALMKTGSVLVNVSRGALIDEAALLAALSRRRPAHAILDVTDVEPLPAASPLWTHPEVRVTGHTDWASDGARRRNDLAFLDNLSRYCRSDPLASVASPSAQRSYPL